MFEDPENKNTVNESVHCRDEEGEEEEEKEEKEEVELLAVFNWILTIFICIGSPRL